MHRLGAYVTARYLTFPALIYWIISRVPGGNEDYQFSLWDRAPFWGLLLLMTAVEFIRPTVLRINAFPDPAPGTLVTRRFLFFILPLICLALVGSLMFATYYVGLGLTRANPPSAGLLLGMYLLAVPLGVQDFFYKRALIRRLEAKME